MTPMLTSEALAEATNRGYLAGFVFGVVLTLLLVGMFVAAGGKVLVERFTSSRWSQRP